MNDQAKPQGRLTVVPHKKSRTERVGIPCKRPTCSSVLDPNEKGRPRDFCTTPCKEKYHREARKALQQLKEELGTAERYGHRFVLVELSDADSHATLSSPSGSSLETGLARSRGSAEPTSETVGSAISLSSGEHRSPVTRRPSVIRSSQDLHETLLMELLHEVGIAIAQLDADDSQVTEAKSRLARSRDGIYHRLASMGD